MRSIISATFTNNYAVILQVSSQQQETKERLM